MNKIIEEAIETCENVIVVDEAVALGGAALIDPRMVANPNIAPQQAILHYSPKGIGELMRFGMEVRNSLQLGAGYSSEVVDFGDAISIKISYTNTRTSMSASQNFIILFTRTSGECIVKTNSQRWRTCNSPSQAASFIRGKVSALTSKTSSMN